MPTGQIAAVVFDMDGVLIEARDWHYEALNAALGIFGYAISRYDHLITYDGLPTRQKLELLSRERALPRNLHSFIAELKQMYTVRMIHERCRPTFAHEYALSRLRGEGYRLAVASNSIRGTIELIMHYANLQQYLDLTLSNEDVRAAKPDPEIYLTTVERLGLTPRQCLVIEDNPHGIAAARASGTHVLAVRDPSEVTYENIRFHIDQIEGSSP